jgi:hypothetical protein
MSKSAVDPNLSVENFKKTIKINNYKTLIDATSIWSLVATHATFAANTTLRNRSESAC